MYTDQFSNRHIGINANEEAEMLEQIGVSNLQELMDQTIPENIRNREEMRLPKAISEYEVLNHLEALSHKNKNFRSYIGLGYHPSISPSVIKRNILENPSWYTAYTPYQAEIAQGRLEALLNFQTVVCDLTKMEIANASLLDESTAAAEAMTMLFDLRSRAQKKEGVLKFFVDENCLPQTLSVLQTRSTPLHIELVIGKFEEHQLNHTYYGAFVQYPGKHGQLPDLKSIASNCKAHDIKLVVAADILSLLWFEAPGTYGVDVVVGTTQRFGIPMGYGGPHAAFFATKEAYKRSVPGRIIGQTIDTDGNQALRMALQTREQHIKRDKATSNICTAQVLLAVMAGMYAVYHGPIGLKNIARAVHLKTKLLSDLLQNRGIEQLNNTYFDTLLFKSHTLNEIKSRALQNQSNFNFIDENHFSVSINETTSELDLSSLVEIISGESIEVAPNSVVKLFHNENIQAERESTYLDHEVFNSYHSETELMRYIKKLERKDLALNQSMIALGSCTMKLNAATQMLPLSWSNWGNIHPFAPQNQVSGYTEVLKSLEDYLTEITGFAATSLQPNSGAQGEYAGLMTIRAYHKANGDEHRTICLIPSSAHGTNPASAVMAGMKVVVVKTDERGNIDLKDLKEKAVAHSENLAALMVTYPSTHGVFESSIKEITDVIHHNGGQVYMDGANMNAQVGLTNPALIGADVCHLNLHKTFAIPHGGGGPGVGPICVAAQLADFLPTNPLVQTGGEKGITAISAAPFGSALACLISYSYIRLLGPKGLTKSTEYAILNTNYIKSRLENDYPILYAGEQGRAAHEMIIDCRPFKAYGIEVTDIAKRLMDYGFHAPTVSFPVAGTMMIEPTESESLTELDRFCDAMLSIKEEILECHSEETSNPLKNAPHTLSMITADDWPYEYSRKKAAFPLDFVRENKFWPSVRRVDEAFGDRNLMCTCAPMESYS